MTEEQVFWLALGGFALLFALLMIYASKRSSKRQQIFTRIAQELGIQDVRRSWLVGAGVRGTWNGYPVRQQLLGRYKGVPERLLTTVTLQSPGRIMITRRVGKVLSKPMTLFGPKLVTPMTPAVQERFWVRSDQPAFVERFFASSEAVPLLEQNLIERFDLVDLNARRLLVRRATDERQVRARYGIATINFKRDMRYIETIAREEWALATMIIRELSLRP
ncbi:MAG TPA: hypothetical protein VGR02_02835 [Thermoanaerobaculia bacterium]|jgi:hypothetical protein|nr:hypothetical protein [Thermoanaerobaculia bacterium]